MTNILKKLPQMIMAVILFTLGILQFHSNKMLFIGLLFGQQRIQSPANIYAASAFFSFALCMAFLVSDNKHVKKVATFLFIGGFILIGVATFTMP